MNDVEPVRVASVRSWAIRAGRMIDARIGDTRAHAWHAVTQRVVTAPDGRKTWRIVLNTRSYQAAVKRLSELGDALAGPNKLSLDGLIQDARGQFYRESFDLWRPDIPAQLLAPDPNPTKLGERLARGVVVHGYNLRDEITDVIDAAVRGLAAAVTVAGGRTTTDDQARAILDAWESQKVNAIRRRVEALLSDSEAAIFNLVGREMVDPKFYAED